MTEIVLHGARPAGPPHPRLGYAMVAAASALFAVNGSVSKVILTSSGMPSLRLTELRATGAFVGLAAFLALTTSGRLRVSRDEVALLVVYGIVGFALVQWLYLVAIERLPIGIGLLLEFTAPVVVALWARLVWHEPVRRRVWAALALALAGLTLVAQVWEDVRLDAVGVAAGFLAAGALATYYLAGEHQTARRDALSLTCLSLGVATLFWAILQPWWNFPFDELGTTVPLGGELESASAPVWALALWVIVAGTILPFVLSLGALHHLPATRVATVSMIEVLLAAIVAWAWLDETLSAAQLAGGAIVLTGVVLAQTSR
jgi:drug/metabolite transporter (DMT)-like permease